MDHGDSITNISTSLEKVEIVDMDSKDCVSEEDPWTMARNELEIRKQMAFALMDHELLNIILITSLQSDVDRICFHLTGVKKFGPFQPLIDQNFYCGDCKQARPPTFPDDWVMEEYDDDYMKFKICDCCSATFHAVCVYNQPEPTISKCCHRYLSFPEDPYSDSSDGEDEDGEDEYGDIYDDYFANKYILYYEETDYWDLYDSDDGFD